MPDPARWLFGRVRSRIAGESREVRGMNDLLVERVSAFVKSPLNNPLTRGEQMELARWFLRIHEQMEVFKQLPDLPITDGQIQCATSVRSTMTTTQTCFSSNPKS